ncbi:MAG: Ig-like domain-containing protein [Verrucomicrobia bacterium]|nr:Ig-like domain-containing protein [Verrucomicrobiota bacterium]
MKTSYIIDPMRAALQHSALAFAVAVGLGLTSTQAAISVGASGSGVQTFATLPAASEWSTMAAWAGAQGDITSSASLDAAVASLTAGVITTPLTESATWPPSSNAQARRNTAQTLVQSKPTGTNKGVLLLATLQNTSGGGIKGLTISYDFGTPVTGLAEEVPGVRAYYSLTGDASSWTVIPTLCTATAGSLTADVTLSSTWADTTTMYVLWADDNAAGTDNAYTIDNVSFARTELGVTITSPANNQALSHSNSITATATVKAPIPPAAPYTVKFFTDITGSLVQTGADVTAPPYQVSLGILADGTYSIYATVTDSNLVSVTSATNTFTVANLPPAVAITSPANNESFALDASIPIAATASDIDGTVTSVDFYADGSLLGTVASPPFSYTWTGALLGAHTLTAVAWDNTGLSSTSAVVNVVVKTVVDISTILTPGPQGITQGILIDTTVGAGNIGKLVGETMTYWGSSGFSVPLILNENTLRINSGGGNTMNASGQISGNGVVSLEDGGANPIRIQGSVGNTYTGTTVVTASGNISLEKTSGDALRGSITVKGTSSLVWVAANQINDASDVTLVNSGGFLNLAGFTDTINELHMITGNYVQTGVLGVLKVSKLFLNGVEQPLVAYGAGDGFVLGTGYIDVGNSGPPVVATAPGTPTTPAPVDMASTVHPANLPKLDWADSSGATNYDVYLVLATDPDPVPGTTPVSANVSLSEYTLGSQVLSLTSYKWQVVARNAVGDTVGPVWTFSTVDRTLVAGNYSAGYSDFTHNLNYIVGVGNSAVLQGNFRVHWSGGPGSFSVPVNTNGFTLDADTGGGNGGHNASGPISGTGSFVITHGPAGGAWDNIYTISGATANTYTGPTVIKRGTILMIKSAGFDALPPGSEPITLGSAGESARLYWGASDQINNAAAITVLLPSVTVPAPDANLNFLDLAGFSDTIAALILPDDGTKTQVRTGTGGVLTVSTLTVNGTVMGPGTYTAANSTFVFGTGSVVVPGAGTAYGTWASANAGGQSADLDHDNDGVRNGVEYFMGATGSTFTANPGVVAGKVTWPRDPTAVATFKVQVSDNLSDTDWTDILPSDPSIDETNPNQVTYTLPGGAPRKFCRLVVITP